VALPELRLVLLLTTGFAVDLATVERIAASLDGTAYGGLEDVRVSVTVRLVFNGWGAEYLRNQAMHQTRLPSSI
jgi:hypothetical protein